MLTTTDCKRLFHLIAILVVSSTFDVTRADQRIPKILHHIYLSGYDHWTLEENLGTLRFQPTWKESCIAKHPGWTYMFWGFQEAQKLLAEHYPFFLDKFNDYKCVVAKGDAMRYFILHAIGGLYLDLDMECFREDADLLKDYDVALQVHKPGEPISNFVMAAAPDTPIFWEAIKEINASWAPQAACTKAVVDSILETTGPKMFGRAVSRAIGMDLYNAKNFTEVVDKTLIVDGRSVHFYGPGSFYMPCAWSATKARCEDAFERQLKSNPGKVLQAVAGAHRWSATWLGR